MKDLIEFMNELVTSMFTGKLTINFYKGNVGKIQVTRTIKSADFKKMMQKTAFKD